MNYQEVEMLFHQEQSELNDRLEINPAAVVLDRADRGWWHLRNTFAIHRIGVTAGYLAAGMSLTLAWISWRDPWISWPFLLAAGTLLVNNYIHPAQRIPDSDLERFTTRELAEKILAFRRYSNRRFPFDALAALPLSVAIAGWFYRAYFGFHPVRDPLWLRPVDGLIIGALLLGPVLISGAMQWWSDRKVGELVKRLEGYVTDELV